MGYMAYPEYRDSHDRWLGKIPTHWKTKPLKFAAKVQPSNVDKKTEDGEIPIQLCNYVDVYKNEAITDGLSFMQATATVEEIAKFRVEAGDVIVTKDSETAEDIAVPAYVPKPLDNLVCGYHLTQIKPELVEGSYLFRLFQSSAFNKQFVLGANGVTRFGLPQHVINDALVCIPDPEEQQAIARFLDHKTAQIDALIAKKEALLQKLAEKRTALISHAVTKGLNPTLPLKQSGIEWIGDIPQHWTTRRIKFAAKLESGHTPSKQVPEYWEDCDIPWVSLNDSKQLAASDYISDTAIQINSLGLANSSARLLPADAVVFTRDATIGLCAITTRPMAVSQHLIAWIPGSDITPIYLLRVFNAMKAFLDSFTFGATIKTIGMPDVKKLAMPIPPLHEQQAITEYIERQSQAILSQARTIEAAIDKLKEYRSALITAAVTGKIDVRHVPIPEAA